MGLKDTKKSKGLWKVSDIPESSYDMTFQALGKTLNYRVKIHANETKRIMVNFLEGKVIDLSAQEWRDSVTGMEFVWIPSGCFQMGSPASEEGRDDEEGPVHKVCLDGFWMGKYEVTQAEWRKVMNNNPSHFKGDSRPVENVSWYDAQRFIQHLNRRSGATFRLPSEAEWEYACRAGTTTPFHFGETISTDQANYRGTYVYGSGKKGTYREQTTLVGSFPANAFSLYDMHGNVKEWCEDFLHDNYHGAPTDRSVWPKGNTGRAVIIVRGGSWIDDPKYLRCAYRNWVWPQVEAEMIGFRLVRAAGVQ